MSKPVYTKKVREEAALICAIAASTPDLAESYSAVASALGISVARRSFYLALWAWDLCQRGADADSEAESLIRTGWTP
jgi:hypothetical protein